MSSKKSIFIVSGLAGGAIVLASVMSIGANADPRGWGWGGMERGEWSRGHGHHGMRGKHHRGKRGFRDANGDGVITKEEATQRRARRFGRFDMDKSGDVTADEAINSIIKRFEGKVRRRVRMFDENGDGKVTLEEFNAPVLERFARMDDNGDGQLSGDELPRHMKRGEGRRGKWRRGHRGGRMQSPPEQAPQQPSEDGENAQ